MLRSSSTCRCRALAGLAIALAAGLPALTGVARAQTTAASPNAALPGIQVDQGWTRPTRSKGKAAPAFFSIRNTGMTADTLISATCPIAEHTVMLGGAGNPIGAIPIKSGETLHLHLTGPHLVLEDTHFRLFPNAVVPCTVNFLSAGQMMIYLKVRPQKRAKDAG